MENKYIPGVCNMGREEIKRRKTGGWTGLILTLVAIMLLWMLDAPKAWRLLVFVPAVAGQPASFRHITSSVFISDWGTYSILKMWAKPIALSRKSSEQRTEQEPGNCCPMLWAQD